ncbi:MAG: hypothetical protein QE484_11050, partial [Rhizobium sp.]|nr:hypothetical protein [Rhizobium sp.]
MRASRRRRTTNIWSKITAMVSRGKSRDRIEPSFDDERDEEDFRLDADDRVVGGRQARSGAKKSKP